MQTCIFCSIAENNTPHHELIWQDGEHLAFLAVPPSKEGHTLVIPKEHSIGILDLSEIQFQKLFIAMRKVALLLKERLDCHNVAIVTEGSSIPHTHVHLIPLRRGEKLAEFESKNMTTEELKKIGVMIKGNVENKVSQ